MANKVIRHEYSIASATLSISDRFNIVLFHEDKDGVVKNTVYIGTAVLRLDDLADFVFQIEVANDMLLKDEWWKENKNGYDR